MSKKEISRRTFLKGTAAAGVTLAASGVLAACGGDASSSTPASSSNKVSSSVAGVSSSVSKSNGGSTVDPYANVAGDGNGWYLWDPTDNSINREGRGATGEKGIVAAGTVEASQAGVAIIEKGGNAVDAACAVSLALSVTEPVSSGIGGGGFITLHSADGTDVFINAREIAPLLADDHYWTLYTNPETGKTSVVNNANSVGGRSIGTPGIVAGLEYAFKKYGSGKVTWAEVCQPAIDLCEKGFYISPTLYSSLDSAYGSMKLYSEFGNTFIDQTTGLVPPVGTLFKNTNQAKALKLIAEGGAAAFYGAGELRDAMIAASNRYGNIFVAEDFEKYEAKEAELVTGTFHGYTIKSTPLPSSGGICIAQIMNIFENWSIDELKAMGHNSVEYIHLFVEITKMVYSDRSKYLGANTEDAVVKALTSKEYAKALADEIKQDLKLVRKPAAHAIDAYMSEDTTSFSVGDIDGNLLSVTQTVNGYFGSLVFADGFGFPMNNEMGDFSTDITSPNAIAGGKCPLSSMSPTVVLDPDGKPFMTLGSPGATTIIVAVVQPIMNVIVFGMDLQEAIEAPRFYDKAANKITYENRIDAAVIQGLVDMGHEVSDAGDWVRGMGSVQGVMLKDGKVQGGGDPRRDGKALGF